MGRLGFGKRRQGPQATPTPEDPVVRQYRYLLRTASADALEAAHTEAISHLATDHQDLLLSTLRGSLMVGDHLTTNDHAKIAHLVTRGEQRTPGQLLAALPAEALRPLAKGVLEAEASFGLLDGYASWDGAEPQPEDESAWADGGFDPKVGRTDPRNDPRTLSNQDIGGGG